MVKLLPFQGSRFVDEVNKEAGEVDGDLSKVFGSRGLKRCVDPPEIWLAQSELHILKRCGLGEVNRRWHIGHGSVCEERSGIDQLRKVGKTHPGKSQGI